MEYELIKTEHLNEEEYCSIVEEEVLIKDENDVKATHEKPFKCGICGHLTTTDTLLKVHMRMHLVKRVHQCNICKRKFNFVTELNRHILTHTEEKSSFQCDTCSRDFFTEEDLQKHSRVHTGEKPFMCKLCSRSFSDDSYLRMHERSHHGEDYVKRVMKQEGTHVDFSLVQNLNEGGTQRVSVSAQNEVAPKHKFKNNPALPLTYEEKLLLLKYVEQFELNKRYLKLEQIKTYIRNSWVKMVELFAQSDYDRTPEKLTRTYFHLKNKAKTRIEAFYKHRKLPKPHEIDYMFVKLCPTDLEIPGIDIQQVLNDSKKFENVGTLEVNDGCNLSEDEDTEVDSVASTRLNETFEDPLSSIVESSNSQKRSLPALDDGPPSKIQKNDIDQLSSQDVCMLKLKFLLAEEQRKENLYNMDLQEKQELFLMEKKHKEEIYKKELEIKNLELTMLKQKMQLCNRSLETDCE